MDFPPGARASRPHLVKALPRRQWRVTGQSCEPIATTLPSLVRAGRPRSRGSQPFPGKKSRYLTNFAKGSIHQSVSWPPFVFIRVHSWFFLPPSWISLFPSGLRLAGFSGPDGQIGQVPFRLPAGPVAQQDSQHNRKVLASTMIQNLSGSRAARDGTVRRRTGCR